MGMNLARATVFRVPDETREEWIERGILSNFSSIGPFSPLDRYESLIEKPTPTGIPCLDRPLRGGATPNYNHLAYIEVSKAYQRDSLASILEAPSVWVSHVFGNLLIFFRPAQEFALRSGNQSSIAGWESFHDRWILWQIAPSDINKAVDGRLPLSTLFLSCSLFWILIYPTALLFGIRTVWKGFRSPSSLIYAFLLFNLVYLILVGNIFEYGENNRFRFMSDPLVLMLVAGGLFARKPRTFEVETGTKGALPLDTPASQS